MARRYDDVYERDVRDRRSRDPRDMRREPEFRERFEPREQSRPYSRESDYLEYSRDSRSDLQTVRDPPSRSAYAYPDKMQRDDVPSRSYPDDRRERHRSPIDLQPQRREEVSLYKEYFLPAEDINREVIQHDICRYLGNEATVRPYQHSDGRQGYLIRAYRALTTAMISTLKYDSKRYEQERRRQYGQPGSYGQSATFDDRQRQGRPDVPQSGYTGYQTDTRMDTRMDTVVDTRMDPRMDPRMDITDPRMDIRMKDYDDDDGYRGAAREYRDVELKMDPRQQLPISRPAMMPPVYIGRPLDTYYREHYRHDVPVHPRTLESNTTSSFASAETLGSSNTSLGALGPNIGPTAAEARVGQGLYSEGYLPATSRSGPAYGDPVSSRPAKGYQVGSGHPGWGDTPNFTRRHPEL